MNENIPYISLSDFTSEYCMAKFNDNRKNYINYLLHAKRIYQKIFLTSSVVVKNKYVKVDTTTSPFSIPVPRDMVRFIAVSNENKNGALRSYSFDDTINETQLPKGNECPSCGDTDDIRACFSNIIPIIENIDLLGNPYVKTTYQKLTPKGDIIEVIEMPVINYPPDNGDPFVEKIIKERTVANLLIKECGCIKKVDINKEIINKCCSIFLQSFHIGVIKATQTQVLNQPTRIKIKNGKIWLRGSNIPKYLILSYQTNGICNEEEIMIPEECVDAMTFGVDWRAYALRDNANPGVSREKKRVFDSIVEDLDEFLNPLRYDEFLDVQMHIPKWGEGSMFAGELSNDCDYEW